MAGLKEWSEAGYSTIQYYDRLYSDWLAIPRSIKSTSIKPSGTVSLLAGATPGMHYPESRFYVRRLRLSRLSELLPAIDAAGYHVEECVYVPLHTLTGQDAVLLVYVSFPRNTLAQMHI